MKIVQVVMKNLCVAGVLTGRDDSNIILPIKAGHGLDLDSISLT